MPYYDPVKMTSLCTIPPELNFGLLLHSDARSAHSLIVASPEFAAVLDAYPELVLK